MRFWIGCLGIYQKSNLPDVSNFYPTYVWSKGIPTRLCYQTVNLRGRTSSRMHLGMNSSELIINHSAKCLHFGHLGLIGRRLNSSRGNRDYSHTSVIDGLIPYWDTQRVRTRAVDTEGRSGLADIPAVPIELSSPGIPIPDRNCSTPSRVAGSPGG